MDNNLKNAYIQNVWEQFSKPLLSYIKARVKTEQDAEDILQNVFIKIHNSIDSINDNEKIQAWVYAITRNTITDYYRKQKDEAELSDDIQINIDNEDELEINSVMSQCVKAMIMHLPEKYKQAVLLTEFQNLSQKELSEKMGISLSGAKSRVQRSRTMIKKMLLSCCQLEFDYRGKIIDYKCSNNKFCQ